MDLTHMQQTVTDSLSSDVSSPQENLTQSQMDTITSNNEQAYEPLSYDELFPALPNASPELVEEETAPLKKWTHNIDMRIASSVITQVFRVPYEERAKIDGNSQFGESASSRICADITARTGAHIEISSAKDQSLTFLVTGKSEEVIKAKRLTLEKFQTQARQVIKIPKEHHRFILGKKGKKLQELESNTGTKIQVPNANDASIDILVIGAKDSIEKAVHEIQLISDEQGKHAYEKLEVPKAFHPFVNKEHNDQLSHLLSANNVRLNIPPPSVPKNEITIAGEKDAVMQCKDLVTKIYREMEKKCQTVSVEVKKSQHKYVIGPRGANIAEILQDTNVSVEMPPSDSVSETITLRGPPDKLGPALTKVYEKANSIRTETVEAPSWLHKFIIGRKGANIKQLTLDYDRVHVEFTDKEGGIKLEGPPEEVEAAMKKLNSIIVDMQERLTYDELAVDPQYYKHIIGKSGSNINRIRSETGVQINISEVDGKNLIRVEGSRAGVDQAKKELIEMVTKMENEIEKEVDIDNRFHRNIIGSKGEKIKEIRELFNQVQISFPDQGERSNVVKIRGPTEDVEKCQQYLKKMANELLESNYQLKVSIFRQFHKFVIGKAGSNINKIREETNTRIELPSEGQNSDEITITGKKENCEKAKERIQKIQNELANIVEIDIMVPGKFHNALIGAGGKLIQSISEECGGVTIKFPPPESRSDKVTIRGPKDDAQKAKQMLVELSNEKQLAGFTAEVKAKPQLHRYLIGRNGVNIRKIRDKTGARIIFPNDKDENREVITIIGKKDSVENARQELETIIKELNQIVEDTVSVDVKHHRHFVSRRGEILRQISDQNGGVTISFPRQGISSDKVTLKGSKDCVEAAKNRLLEIVTNLDQMVTENVTIPQKFHRTVMGARGSKVQAITSEFDVQIKFPEKDFQHGEGDSVVVNGDSTCRPQDIVVVQGLKSNCEAAKNALLALVPITEDLSVTFKYHRFIIGQKGETVRALMAEHDVNIQVPPAQDQKDIISITGPPSNVETAKAAILKKVEDLLGEEEDRAARSFHVQLRVDPEYHPKIIGRKGTVISKIREKHDVNIQFPQRGSPDDDLITITGYEKNCNDARDAILAITGDLENMVRKSVKIDPSIHSRLIGTRGRAIKKIMDEFKVEIRFPRGEEDPDEVVVLGPNDNVDDCCEHLLNTAEEYMQDKLDQDELKHLTYSHSTNDASSVFNHIHPDKGNGFVVKDAPWTQPTPNVDSSEDFPSMSNASTPSVTTGTAWGPKRS